MLGSSVSVEDALFFFFLSNSAHQWLIPAVIIYWPQTLIDALMQNRRDSSTLAKPIEWDTDSTYTQNEYG